MEYMQFFFPRLHWYELTLLHVLYGLCVSLFRRVHTSECIGLAVCPVSTWAWSWLHSADCVLWYGMYAESFERCLKEGSSLPPTHWGYWGHWRKRECFPSFHALSSLFLHFFFHSSRKTFELLFLLWVFLCSHYLSVSWPLFLCLSCLLLPYKSFPQLIVFMSTSPQCLHQDLCVSLVRGPWHHSAATSLTGFVCKELSTRGRRRALSWLPSTNKPLLHIESVYFCLAVMFV